MSENEEYQYDVEGNPIKKKKDRMDISVKVDTTTMEQLIEQKKELEEEKEALQTDLEDAQLKLELVAEQKIAEKHSELVEQGMPEEIRSIEDMKAWEENHLSNASGQVPLTRAQTGEGEGLEFESHEDLVAYLREVSDLGTPSQKKQANAVIDKLYEKQFKALKEGDMPSKVYEDKPEESGESIIKKVLRKKNESIRKKRLGEKNE